MNYRRNTEPDHDDHHYAITYTSMGDVFRVMWPGGLSPYDKIIAFDLDCCQSFDLYNNLKGMNWDTIVRICKRFWIKDDYLQQLFNMLGSSDIDRYDYTITAINNTIDVMMEIIPDDSSPSPGASKYRRNADEELRRLERGAEDPQGQARLLAARLRAGQIIVEQIRVAACLRHPAAVILYPDDVGGPGAGDRPMLDAEGMVVHCAGAAQLGVDIQSKIDHLPPERMANILLTIVTKVLDDIEVEYVSNQEQPTGFAFIPEVQDLLQNAWEIIATGFPCEEEARIMMRQLRLRAAAIGNYWRTVTATHDPHLASAFCGALDRAITVANVFFEIEVDGSDEYRSMLGVKAFLREVCRFDPEIIDTWAIAAAVLG